jgi:hypothetical protein
VIGHYSIQPRAALPMAVADRDIGVIWCVDLPQMPGWGRKFPIFNQGNVIPS